MRHALVILRRGVVTAVFADEDESVLLSRANSIAGEALVWQDFGYKRGAATEYITFDLFLVS